MFPKRKLKNCHNRQKNRIELFCIDFQFHFDYNSLRKAFMLINFLQKGEQR